MSYPQLAGSPWRSWENNIEMDLKGVEWGLEIALMWLKTRSSEGLFWTWYWVLGFHEVWIIFWIAKVTSCWQEWLFHRVCEMDFCLFLMFCYQKPVRISQTALACYVSHPTPFGNRILILFYWKDVLVTAKYTCITGLSILWCSCSGRNAGNSGPGKFLSSTACTCLILPVGCRHRFTLVI